jgi:hypothetical protein
MIEKALKGAAAEGVKALEHQGTNMKAEMNHSLATLEHYKRLVAELVKLSAEIREGDYFAKVQALKVGEVTLHGDHNPAVIGLQMGHGGGGYIQLSGFPDNQELLPSGRYRIVVTLQKVGDL